MGPALIACGTYAKSGGQSGAGMSSAVAIMLPFGAHRKATQAACAADSGKTSFAPGEKFVDIAFVADIPDEFVFRRAEDIVQGDRQFDNAEVRPEVAAIFGEHGDQLVA